jgi:hypothetical protein
MIIAKLASGPDSWKNVSSVTSQFVATQYNAGSLNSDPGPGKRMSPKADCLHNSSSK